MKKDGVRTDVLSLMRRSLKINFLWTDLNWIAALTDSHAG